MNYFDRSGHFAISLIIWGIAIGMAVGFGIAAYCDYSDDNKINGSVGLETHITSVVACGILGAGIVYAWPVINSFASSSFTIGGELSMSGGAAVLTTGITITGAQILEGAGILAGLGIMYIIPKQGKLNTKITDGGSYGEYDSNGNLSYRVDTTGRPHYIKSIGKYCLPHIHKFTWKLIDGIWRFVEEVLPYIL